MKGFSIAGLILALLAIITPYGINFLVGGAALILVSIGALAGDKAFAIATSLITAANLFFFSPATLAVAAGTNSQSSLLLYALITMALPIVAIILNGAGVLALGAKK